MQTTTRRGKGGVTLTELLAVLAIVGLLATLAVPVVINRAATAKFNVAKAEVQALAKGEELAGLVHGYYVAPQVLDDIPYDGTSLSYNSATSDDIRNERLNYTMFLIDVATPIYNQFVGVNANQPRIPPIATTPNTNRLFTLETDWQGPFTQWQRRFKPTSATYPSAQYEILDHPLDPWGNPYRLYSPIGITGDNAGTGGTPLSPAVMDSFSFSNGRLSQADDRFDRFAIVSFGPDGESDGTNPNPSDSDPEDDIIYIFGSIVPETTFVIP